MTALRKLGWKISLVAAIALALLAAGADFLAPTVFAGQSLPAPGSVDVSRGDGTLSISWSAVDGATGYNVNTSDNGMQSWSRAKSGVSGTSATLAGVSNGETYVVAVQAINANGVGGWRNSAPVAPYAPPATSPPATPSGVTLARGDGTLTASWVAVSGADDYHVTYSSDGGSSWSLAAFSHPTSSITISVSNDATYKVGVRAKNSAGGSGWRNSAASPPHTPPASPPATPASVSVTRADGSITAAWPLAAGADSYHVTYSSNGGSSWSLAAYGHAGASVTIDDADNESTYVVGVRALNQAGGSGWRNSAPAGPYTVPTLTATNETMDGATLTLANYSGDWYYSAEGGAGGQTEGAGAMSLQQVTCHGPVNGGQATIGGLDPNTEYTVTAYVDCGGAAIASSELVTAQNAALTHSNVGLSTATITRSGFSGAWWFKGSAPYSNCTAAGSGDTAQLSNLSSGASQTFTAYGSQYCGKSFARGSTTFTTTGNPLQLIENNATNVTIAPHASWSGPWYYKSAVGVPVNLSECTGPITGSKSITGLRAEGTVVLLMYGDSTCETLVGALSVRTPRPGLSVAGFEATAVNLAIERWKGGWEFRQESPSVGPCITVTESLTSKATGLIPGQRYTFKAYQVSGVGCADSLLGATVTFTVPELAVDAGSTSASLTLSHWSGPWWFRALGIYSASSGDLITYTGGPCRGPAQGSATATLAGLGSGYEYGLKAYDSYSACAADLAKANGGQDDGAAGVLGLAPVKATTLETTTLYAGKINGGVRLTLGNWGKSDGDWWYRANVIVPHANSPKHGADGCRGPVTGGKIQHDDTNLPVLEGLGVHYVFTVYPVAGCHYSSAAAYAKLSDAAIPTPTLAASNIEAWSATLTLNGHPGSWYYKANAAPHATCSEPVHGASETLTGLTASTASYVYTAYSDSNCTTVLATASAFSTPDPPPSQIDSVNLGRGNGTLIASWAAPADNGFSITGYDVEYRASTATTWASAGTSTSTSKTISSVTNATSYAVRVRAVNTNGNAEWREATVGALTAPSAPTGLSRNGWVLSWNAPSNTGNAAINRYEIECRRGLNKGTVHSTSGSTSVTLTHSWCKQWSNHGNHARVRARNAGNLYGPWSGWLRLQ